MKAGTHAHTHTHTGALPRSSPLHSSGFAPLGQSGPYKQCPLVHSFLLLHTPGFTIKVGLPAFYSSSSLPDVVFRHFLHILFTSPSIPHFTVLKRTPTTLHTTNSRHPPSTP